MPSLLPHFWDPEQLCSRQRQGRGNSAALSAFKKHSRTQLMIKMKTKANQQIKSITQSFDGSQERAVQSADCKVIDRGFHFTHFHSNLAIPVPQCQDRSLVQGGMKKGRKRSNNYKAQGTKNGKGECSAICSTENFHSTKWRRGKKAR